MQQNISNYLKIKIRGHSNALPTTGQTEKEPMTPFCPFVYKPIYFNSVNHCCAKARAAFVGAGPMR